MSHKKNCKQCGKKFVVEESDVVFYAKVSPTFDGKVFEIPDPALCSSCRNQRRMALRNVIHLYNRKCDLCGKTTISMYSPDKEQIVYCHECWWSDKWSHTDFAQEYDPNRSFIEQIIEFKKKVPAPAIMHSGDENSDYINLSNDNKNCYLVFLSGRNEDCYYGYWTEDSKNSVDTSFIASCELCYEGVNLGRCYNCKWIINSADCRDCLFIEDSANCSDCIMCSRQSHKQYLYKNKQLTKEEYDKVKAEFVANLEDKLEDYKKEFREIILTQPKKFAQTLRSENCTGDDIFGSKNCINCFRTESSEDCQNSTEINRGKDMYDVTGFGLNSELIYESQNIGINSNRCAFISFAYGLSDSYYCEHCYYSKNLFGCVGAKNHAEFCILNKQYSRDDYEKKVAQIINDMQKRGEWGEFFPPSFSSFGYNETVAMEYFPFDHEQAKKLGYFWQEKNPDVEFSGTPYEPLKIEKYIGDESERKKLLDGVLKCQKTGRPYKISPQELLFYIKNNIPIPRIHWAQRMTDRLNLLNKNQLFHRQCMCKQTNHDHQERCTVEFETTYSPDRPEIVYCENCYWHEEK